jgi:hypothetical protein
MTYFPQTGFTYAVLYGCDEVMAADVKGRLTNSEDAISHPLLLPGILAEFERKRQIELVTRRIAELLQTTSRLSDKHTAWEAVSGVGPNRAINPWMDTHYLKNGLENWKEQLLKLVSHVDELSEMFWTAAPVPAEGQVVDGQVVTLEEVRRQTEEEYRKSAQRQTGLRIKERLQEIICDYNEQIRKCVLIMEGMTLATQLVSKLSSGRLLSHGGGVADEQSYRHTRKQTWTSR